MGRNKYREDLWDIFSPSEMEWIQKALSDAERFDFICHMSSEHPARFRKMMSHALTLDEYRKAVDEEMAK